MQIAPETIVTMNFFMTDDEGNVLDQSQDNSFSYLHGAGRILPALERALDGHKAGDCVEVELQPADAFGERDESLMEIAPIHLFKGAPVKPGMQFQARAKDGRVLPLRVAKVEGDNVYVDANHPLAGIKLFFSVDILGVRKATEQELQHGHAHGEHGQDH